MPFDMSRCPQNEEEAYNWFYAGIGKTPGAPADDWEAVMTNCGLPPGFGPGVKPTASMPFFAFTQQFSGVPKGRLFLPSDQPDENGYYTRCMQYLEDSPTVPGGLIWGWYLAGPNNPYVPVQGASNGVPIPGNGVTRGELYAILADYFKVDDKLALEVNSGKIICVESGGPTTDNQPIVLTSRSSVGPWESLRMKRGQ
jgi:hypothetical protein